MPHSFIFKGQTVRRIQSQDGSTQADFIPAWGGIASSLRVPSPTGPRELLYQHDFFWNPVSEKTRGGSPLLFPACGRIERNGDSGAYLLNGRIYHMPIHGFASRCAWEVEESTRKDELTLCLSDSESTRVMYPFPFSLRITHRAETGSLRCRHTLRNTGSHPLPYNLGFHPFLLTPPPGSGKEQVKVDVEVVRQLIYNERLTDLTGDGPARTLPAAATDEQINESIHEVGARAIGRLLFPDGFCVQVEAAGEEHPMMYRFMQLYTMPEKSFFCIEPWTGHPNAFNTVDGSRWLEPGAEESGSFRIHTPQGTAS